MLDQPSSPKKLPIAPHSAAQSPLREDLAASLQASEGCALCKLHRTRCKVVSGAGNPEAVLAFVGEGPGRDEDAAGLPFISAAGNLLERMLEAMSRESALPISRESVFITNCVRCRPPQNRRPESDELKTCEPYLWATLRALPNLRVVVALGNTPLRVLSADPLARITYQRGKWFERCIPSAEHRVLRIMPTFHPAYLLRTPTDKPLAWSGLQEVVREINK